jgi:two-component system, OmpR family, KDP operon response regulator KdpE
MADQAAKVLVIDDDPSLLRALRVGLRTSGHDVTTASTGEQGISRAALGRPDVIVLDLGLPDLGGIAVVARIRQWSDVPILVLSATETEERKVAALDAGADDYVTKPFGMAELEARIRAVIRHGRNSPERPLQTEVSIGRVELDLLHREARVAGERVELTAKEFDVLAYLAQNAGKTCTHQMILMAVWGRAYAEETQYLHAYVHRLRQKLGSASGVLIKTAPGIGYVLDPSSTVST